jgi:hypothetical protein
VCVDAKQEGGHTLRGWLIEPLQPQEQKEPQKRPTTKSTLLIQAHGAGRDRRSWLRHTSFLRGAGYACLAFDFTDHGSFLLPTLLLIFRFAFFLLALLLAYSLLYY